ncbi:Conserved hypothetical protein [Geotrichum candidum]|uniref:Uncharacterized protein n=1 Tax=Geotrichum candidum TaxID=1173061 RepID=A0A0J9XIR3_GEOCN|nr:Conserved hypothetical protein [Geotrichum candidum]
MSVNKVRLPFDSSCYTHTKSGKVLLKLTPITSKSNSIIESKTGGTVSISTTEVVYIPLPDSATRYHVKDKGDKNFESLSIPLDRVRDSHVTTPFIGPNGWVAVIFPSRIGGLEPFNEAWKLELTFSDGGAYEFEEAFVKCREARELGQNHIDDLPVYDDSLPPSYQS